jgi:subtilase family serine protease
MDFMNARAMYAAGIIIVVIILVPFIWWVFRPCLPDLLVESYSTGHVGENYSVHVVVENDGCAKSGECLVYCNAISMTPPVGENEIRAQRSCILGELQPGQTTTCSFTFTFQVLANETVGIIEILVDAKDFVVESNEDNNFEWFIWS